MKYSNKDWEWYQKMVAKGGPHTFSEKVAYRAIQDKLGLSTQPAAFHRIKQPGKPAIYYQITRIKK
ncbi:hypothetical protein [Lactobacillus selangorensis]|nr:hypothetical protein [Lactobacillus selangorensis]